MAVTKFLARDILVEILADVGATRTPVTGDAATDVITSAAHGFTAGERVQFVTITGGGGLVISTTYYVRDATVNTFKLAATAGGAAIDMTTALTAGSIREVGGYTEIEALTEVSHSPSTERADTSSFDEAGRASHLVASRGDSFELTGHKKIDLVTGAGSPGQEAVEASALRIGPDAEESYRYSVRGSGVGIVFVATVELTRPGGGTNDVASWGAALEVTGAVTPVVIT